MTSQHRNDADGPRTASGDPVRTPATKAAYQAPRLQPLGTWSAVTLQMSVPIFP